MDDGGTTRGGGVGVASGDEEAGADAEAVMGAKPESFSPTSVSMSAACSARSALSLERV